MSTIRYDGRRIESIATIFPSRIQEDKLSVNFNGQYYWITLKKLKEVIRRHEKMYEIQKAQKMFDEKKGTKSWRRKKNWGSPISKLITVSIWRYL